MILHLLLVQIIYSYSAHAQTELGLGINLEVNDPTLAPGETYPPEAGSLIFPKPDPVDCYMENVPYLGNISTASDGSTCQRWDTQLPNNHNYTDRENADEHYCRSFDAQIPWCFTLGSVGRLNCSIPICNKDCYVENGHYIGYVNTTSKGKCQKWDSQTPHTHKYGNYPDADDNYCRSYEYHRPWCFIQGEIRWYNCTVPKCSTTETYVPTEAPAGVPTEGGAVNAPAEVPTESGTPIPTETTSVYVPVEAGASIPTEAPTEAPAAGVPTEGPAIISTEASADVPTEGPAANVPSETLPADVVKEVGSINVPGEATVASPADIPPEVSNPDVLTEGAAGSPQTGDTPVVPSSNIPSDTQLPPEASIPTEGVVTEAPGPDSTGPYIPSQGSVNDLPPIVAQPETTTVANTGSEASNAQVVGGPPKVNIADGTYTVTENNDISITCIVNSSSEISDIEWIRNGRVIQSMSTPGIISEVYTVKKAKPEDEGYYTCKAHNYYGSNSDFTILQVKKPSSLNTAQKEPDRILGGVSGGGFSGMNTKPGLCEEVCGPGVRNCFRKHNCTHYNHCFGLDRTCNCVIRPCAYGTLWNPLTGHCVDHHNAKCEPCAMGSMYRINCRAVVQCSSNRKLEPICCTVYNSFNTTSGHCEPDDNCDYSNKCGGQILEPHREITTKKPTPTPCRFRASSHIQYYFDIVGNVRQKCADGTVYSNQDCLCKSIPVSKATPGECNPSFFSNFIDSMVGNMAKSKLKLKKIDIKEGTSTEGGNYGGFNGRTSRIEMPFFQGQSLRNLAAKITFFTDGIGGPSSQVLLSNCATNSSSSTLSPSLSLTLQKMSGQLIFYGKSTESETPALIRLPFKPKQWNFVELTFDGQKLTGKNRWRNSQSDGKEMIEHTNDAELKGELIRPIIPLYLGGCGRSDSLYGYVDMFKIFKCVPKEI